MDHDTKEMLIKLLEAKVGKIAEIDYVNPVDESQPSVTSIASGQSQVVAKFTKPTIETLEIFLKTCRENTEASFLNNALFTFEKEMFFYENISTFYSTLLKSSKHFRDEDNESIFISYYGKGKVGNDIYIVFKNFIANNFYVTSKEALHNLPVICSVMQKLAMFHACCFISNPEETKQWQDFLTSKELFSPKNHSLLYPYFTGVYEKHIKLIKAIFQQQNCNAKLLEHGINFPDIALIESLGNVSNELLNILHCLSTRKNNFFCLCHGDFHMWNIAFSKGNPNCIKFFDYQVVRFTSLATDILHYMYQVCSPAFRKQHLQTILQEYCSSFNKIVKDYSPEHVMFKDKLYDEYKDVSAWGFIYGFIFLLPRFVSKKFYSEISNIDDPLKIIELLTQEATSTEIWNILNIYSDMIKEAVELDTVKFMQSFLKNPLKDDSR